MVGATHLHLVSLASGWLHESDARRNDGCGAKAAPMMLSASHVRDYRKPQAHGSQDVQVLNQQNCFNDDRHCSCR